MITVKIIDKEHSADINIPNEPFKLFGLMLPSYNNGKWDHTVINFPSENHTEMCFPDENYDYDKMSENHIFIGAYDADKCIGLAIMRDRSTGWSQSRICGERNAKSHPCSNGNYRSPRPEIMEAACAGR